MEESWAAGSSLCNMDPTKIILENVGRNFNGNYSCQVRTEQNIIFSALITLNSLPG